MTIGSITLRPYQVRAVDGLMRALDSTLCGLDCSDTGTGKTFTALGTVARYDCEFLVIAKATAVRKWERAVEDCGLSDRCIRVTTLGRLRNGVSGVCVKQTLGRTSTYAFTPLSPGSILIFDEIQDCGSTDSLNAQVLMGARRRRDIGIIGLSATAIDSPLRMRALGFCLGLHAVHDFYPWCLRNGCGKGPFGMYFKNCECEKRGRGGCSCSRDRHLTNIHRHIFPSRGVRVRREDVADQMPREDISVELWDVGDSIPRWMRPYHDRIAVSEADDESRHEDGVPSGVERMRERQRAELMSIPEMASEIAGDVAEGFSVPVFLNFTASIDALVEGLAQRDVASRVYDGRHVGDRQGHLDSFQRGELRVLICQSQAGSVSVDMHDTIGGHPRRSYVKPCYDSRVMIQTLGRACRLDAKTPVQQRIIFAEGTIEERVYHAAAKGCENIRMVNSGQWEDAFGR